MGPLAGWANNIWVEFNTRVAAIGPENCANCGQGFPDFPPPKSLLSSAGDIISGTPALSQYTRSGGHVRLVRALARLYGPLLQQELDPLSNVVRSCRLLSAHERSNWGSVGGFVNR